MLNKNDIPHEKPDSPISLSFQTKIFTRGKDPRRFPLMSVTLKSKGQNEINSRVLDDASRPRERSFISALCHATHANPNRSESEKKKRARETERKGKREGK